MKKFESLPLTFSLLIFLVGVLGCGQKMLEAKKPLRQMVSFWKEREENNLRPTINYMIVLIMDF